MEKNEKLKVRFAPSPTGPFHIGGARSALFNWLLARRYGGTFLLRIEDTDQDRSKPEWEENIKAALHWLEIEWDEGVDVGGPNGPYRQMERLALYKQYTDKLLAEGKAYYCYCTPEELEAERKEAEAKGEMPRYSGKCRNLTPEQIAAYEAQGRKPTVRFRVLAGQDIVVHDKVRGDVHFESDGIGDFVIVKSDGIPTYNYAVVIDDALMGVNCVIRAEEHLSNTPRQILIYEALGFSVPDFGHVSLILGPDHKKMSKRHGATSVDQYRQMGYLPDAIVNFLALLGWAPNSEQEIFTRKELCEQFDLEHVAKNPAVFDIKKLNWLNAHYLRQLTDDAYVQFAIPFMVEAGYMTGEETGAKKEWLHKVILTAKEQAEYGKEIPEKVSMYFSDTFAFETNDDGSPKAILALQEETVPTVIKLFLEKLAEAETLDHDSTKALFKQVQKTTKLGGKHVYMPIRVALTGNQHGPELAEMIPLLGKERTAARIRESLQKAGITL